MNTKNWLFRVLAGVTVLAGSTFAQAPDLVAKIKADAEAGDAWAQARYAQMLCLGKGVEKNEAEALKWFQKSADAGNHYAQANMGLFCLTGGCGMMKDVTKAVEWYEKASRQGNVHAQYELARLYEEGNGVSKDVQKASELYGKSAKGGLAAAQSQYAIRLAQGEGIEQNISEALTWCEKAAAAGDATGKKVLPIIKAHKEKSDKTPKSLLGVEFGKTIEKVTGVERPWKKQDGSAVQCVMKPTKPFRKFTGANEIHVFASVTSHSVFRFEWMSEDFAEDTKEEEAVEEVKKTCAVMAKRFGADFMEIPIKESDKWTIWDRKYMASWGDLKVEIKLESRKIIMTATNVALEIKAKKEVAAIRDVQGDGSDAL